MPGCIIGIGICGWPETDIGPTDMGPTDIGPTDMGPIDMGPTEGPTDIDGNRRMINKLDLVDTPVGNVPGETQGKTQLAFSLRIYRYSWQRLEGTSVKGPIMLGFDEVRFGEANRNGTGYSDVHPTQQACIDRCPAADGLPTGSTPSDPTPRPPTNLAAD